MARAVRTTGTSRISRLDSSVLPWSAPRHVARRGIVRRRGRLARGHRDWEGMAMEVRWGFVGAGNVTQAKASPTGAFTQAGSRVVAVARADAARAEAYAQANGI